MSALDTMHIQFKKVAGFSGLKGEVFEIKLCSLIFLRALKKELWFSMASSVDGFGKFDDIVFQIDGPEQTCLFLQLKYKNSQIITKHFLAPKNAFSLHQYYQSYIEIEQLLQCNGGIKFENCVFILYTNAEVHESLRNQKLPQLGTEQLVVTNSECVLKFNKKEHPEIYEALKDLPKHKQFLRQLRIMYAQATEKKLDNLIKETLSHFQVDNSDINNFHKLYHSHVQDWWLGNFRLTQEWSDFSPLKKAQEELLTNKLGLRIEEIAHTGIRFVYSAVEELKTEIQGHQAVVVFSSSKSTTVTVARIHQVLSGIGTFLFVNTTDFTNHGDIILSTWKKGKFKVLVVECGNAVAYNFDIYTEISEILCEEKKIVVILPEIPNMKEIQHIRTVLKHHYFEVHDSVRLSDFVDETQKMLLKKTIMFQGAETSLATLIEASDKHTLDTLGSKTLSLLLGGEMLVVGIAVENILPYNIDRTLETKHYVSHDILKETGALFAVHNATVTELQNLVPPGEHVCTVEQWHNGCRYIVLDNTESFLRVNNAHCLCKEGERFTWRQSEGDIAIIRRHLDPESSKSWQPKSALDGENKVMMVIAEPGMGKSSLMTQIAYLTKRCHAATWVVKVNLNAYTKTLSDIKISGFNQEEVINVLAQAAGVNKQGLEMKLFTNSLISKGNMVVLLDGVDEVSPNYFKEVVQIVNFLCSTEVQKIWLTARPHMKTLLEKQFRCPTHYLRPFTTEDDALFLIKFWRSRRDFAEGILISVVRRVVKLADECFGDHEKHFMGIPLQASMVAEVFGEQDATLLPQLPQRINFLSLYDRFVKKKWEIYVRDKNKSDVTNANVIGDNDILYKKFLEDHKLAALVAILSQDELRRLHDKNISLNDFNEVRMQKTGIITEIVDGKPQFLHRTVAEYFVAKWFADHLQENRVFLLNHLLERRFQQVRLILDHILTEDFPLHLAVLNGEADAVDDQVDTLDRGGRTPLHLAVSYQHPDQVRHLLTKGCDIGVVDDILHLTPLQYAVKINNWDVLAEFLSERPELGSSFFSNKNVQHNKYSPVCLHSAVKRGLVSLLDYLLDSGISVNFKLSREHSTLLHEAARWGQTDIIQLLVARGCNVNIKSKSGNTALHVSSHVGHSEVTRVLISHGCEMNIVDNFGMTPLYIASQEGHVQTVSLLIRNSCDVNLPDMFGWTPLYIASRNCHVEVVHLLIDANCEVNVANNLGRTPVNIASRYGHTEVVRYLVSRGCDVNIVDTQGRTPLYIASRYGHTEVARILISSGCNMNVYDKLGRTALYIASRIGHVEVVRLLLESCCDVNIAGNNGRIPLGVAYLYGHLEVARLLSNIADKDGR